MVSVGVIKGSFLQFTKYAWLQIFKFLSNNVPAAQTKEHPEDLRKTRQKPCPQRDQRYGKAWHLKERYLKAPQTTVLEGPQRFETKERGAK